jgi:hypothetical protein
MSDINDLAKRARALADRSREQLLKELEALADELDELDELHR